MKQFDIVLLNLDPIVGHEQGGYRPCLVVQTNAGLDKSRTIMIVPFTSNIKRRFSFDILIDPNSENGLSETSRLKFDQTRVVDKKRIIKTLGQLEETWFEDVLKGLDFIFDRNQQFA